MSQGTIFTNNNIQNISLPIDMNFPKNVKFVIVRAVGNERILSPVENLWDSFFMNEPQVSDDFMLERAEQYQSEREGF